ncbi:MAG: zinc-binding dehydrogenase [Verrucomicrobiaceae bacterium]|nr:zinc-binding dehydrogenase [Verrucomicrobiaceae bacterium]
MRQYQLHSRPGEGLDLLLKDVDEPTPLPNEVVIRVRATSLNYRDLLMRSGQSASSAKPGGTVPLSDGAGEVISVGEDVSRVAVGDRVAGCFFSHWIDGRFNMRYHDTALGGSAQGMLSEQVVLPEVGVVKLPDYLSFAEAACFPCAGLTAWYALVERGELTAGDKVLMLGTGGVSIFALKLAKAMGAEAWITSSSDSKLGRARVIGADHTINYKTSPEWEKLVWEQTSQNGVDHVVEVGGAGTLGTSMAAVGAGGHIALIGVLTGFNPPDTTLFPLVARNVRLNGIYVGHRSAFERLLAAAETHQLCPEIDKTFAFEDAAAAYDYLASGGHFGKVVVDVG